MLSVFGLAAALDPHAALLQLGPAALCKTRSRGWGVLAATPPTTVKAQADHRLKRLDHLKRVRISVSRKKAAVGLEAKPSV